MTSPLENVGQLANDDVDNKRPLPNGEECEETAIKKQKTDAIDRVKRKKVVMLMGYSGKDYYGMQRNPGMKTIEEDLIHALLKANLITDEAFETIQTIQFQRAARTDKGVSAARQVVSLKLPDHASKEDINAFLPEQIRIFGIKRVTKGFNSKSQCDARTYTYTLPTFAFAPESRVCKSADESTPEEFDLDKEIEELSTIEGEPFYKYRITPESIDRVIEVLSLFEGTHNFHNFTSKVKPYDPSANRYIIKFSSTGPFVSRDLEFLTLKVKGQSFMLHQIRKMVALAIAIVRNLTTKETLTAAYGMEKMDIPIAPSLGLVLDQVHYDRYNQRYSKDGIHEALEWPELDEEIDKFKNDHILEHIIESEEQQKSMLKWLATLNLHKYGVREEHING